jgi:hypothetical protein
MAQAMEEGDTEKAAEANQAMINAATQLSRLEEQKNSLQFQPQPMEMLPTYNYPEEPQYPPEPDVYDELDRELEREEELERQREIDSIKDGFLRDNPWVNPESPLYDRVMHLKLIRKTRQMLDQTDDEDYANSRDILDDAAKEVFSETKNRSTGTKRSSSMVAPVSRNGGNSGRGSNEYTITKLERAVVERMPELMKEQNVDKLSIEYLQTKEKLKKKGELGRGVQGQYQGFARTSTTKGDY